MVETATIMTGSESAHGAGKNWSGLLACTCLLKRVAGGNAGGPERWTTIRPHMKTSRAFALVAAALVAGFLTARWCAAQPSNQPSGKEPASDDFGALQQYESFVRYLQDTGQTNTLRRLKECSNASLASQQYADLGVTLTLLQTLREGHKQQVYDLLEGKLDADIVGFATSYRELPVSLQKQRSLKVLGNAKEYRARNPFPHGSRMIDDSISEAFKILEEK